MSYNLRNRFSMPEDDDSSSAMPDPSLDHGVNGNPQPSGGEVDVGAAAPSQHTSNPTGGGNPSPNGKQLPLSYTSKDVYAVLDTYRSDCNRQGIEIPSELRYMFGMLARADYSNVPATLSDQPVRSMGRMKSSSHSPSVGARESVIRERTPALNSVHNYVPPLRATSHNGNDAAEQVSNEPAEDYIRQIDDLDLLPMEHFEDLKASEAKPHPIRHTYDGGDKVEAFESMCLDVMLHFQTSLIRSNTMRIKYMAQAFTGRASHEFAALLGQMPPPTPGDVLRHIRGLLPDNISHQARREILTISQGNSTVSVYEDRLRRIAKRMRYCSMLDLSHYFFAGLDPHIAARLSGNGIDPDIHCYEDIVDAASRIEKELHTYQSRMKLQRLNVKVSRPERSAPRAEVDTRKSLLQYGSKQPSQPHRTNILRTDLSKVQCHSCRQYGHYAKDCPQLRGNRKPVGINQLEACRNDVLSINEPSDEEFEANEEQDDGFKESVSTDNQTTSYTTADEQVDDHFVSAMNINADSLDNESDDYAYDLGLASVFADYPPEVKVIKANKARVETETPARPVAIKNCVPFSPGKNSWDKYKYVRIHATISNHSVVCMIDSGSNADLISSNVVGLYNLPTKKLENQLLIKLACLGSRTKCNEFCELPLVIDGRQYIQKLLVLNISENVILGTPFLFDNSASVKLNPPGIHIEKLGRPIETTPMCLSHLQVDETFPIEVRLEKRKLWENKFNPLTSGIPDRLPKFRTVNHEIKLIDENKTIPHRRPRCAEALYPLLQQKIDDYVSKGLWEKVAVESAPPLLALPKPKADGLKLRAVVDKRSVNDNTVKDLTPFPDQSLIRRDFARAKYRSKLDMTDAYEQVRIIPEHVNRTAFATPMGCFISKVLQQGDCNAPATFQRLMSTIFSEGIGSWIHVYLDDIFVFTNTLDEHERCLQRVFDILQSEELFLSQDKVYFFTESSECLGFTVDDEGIHPDPAKIRAIMDWPEPSNPKDIMRFLGLVNYIMNQVPLLSIKSASLSNLTHLDEKWRWGPVEMASFQSVKQAVENHLVLKPIDWVAASSNPNMKVFVVCDASSSGVGAVLGQGPSWNRIVIADMWSSRFSVAQSNYPTHQQELLAIVGALDKFEDQLMGRRFSVATDHRSLEYFKKQPSLSPRQVRWYEFLSKFHFDIVYVKGDLNIVADALSRKHEGQPIQYDNDFVDIDHRLEYDEDSSFVQDDNIMLQNISVVETSDNESLTLSKVNIPKLRNRAEDRHVEAEGYAKNQRDSNKLINNNDFVIDENSHTKVQELILNGYKDDKFFAKVLANEESSRNFFKQEKGFIFHLLPDGRALLAIPLVFLKGRSLRELIIDHFHVLGGHLGYDKTLGAVRRHVWWPSVVKDIDAFCKSCHTCAMTKTPNKVPDGFAHPLSVPQRPWDVVSMDFIGPFPPSNDFNYLWVIVDKLTSMVHLIPTTTVVSAKKLAEIYFERIFPLHGLPKAIVSDRDSKFVSKFWSTLHKILGTTLLMSSAYHPQTDGATERVNRTVGSILRSMVSADQFDWYEKLPFVEFALNSSTSKATGFSPFELNYGYVPNTLHVIQFNVPFEGVRSFVEAAHQNLMSAHDSIISARMNSAANTNKQRKATPSEYKPGSLVYLSTKNLSIPQGLTRKLIPKYIGPFKILKEYPNTSTFKLELPPTLRIHPSFHSSLLKPYIANDDDLFPNRQNMWAYTLDLRQDEEYVVDSIIGHHRSEDKRRKLYFVALWGNGEVTTEPLSYVDELEALDHYLELKGVGQPSELQ